MGKLISAARTTIISRPRPSISAQNRIRHQVKLARDARRKILRARIKEKGLTMTLISARTGIDLSYVSRIISGARVPGLDTTMRLARTLDFSLEELAAILIPDLDLVTRETADLPTRKEGGDR